MDQQQDIDDLIQHYRSTYGVTPTEETRGLPNEAFVSQTYYEAEQKRLFARSWVFAGTLSDVPEKGDIKSVSVGGRTLIIVRDQNNDVHVYYNVCRHRGAQLVAGELKGRRTITCPYHRWTYDLAGELRVRPHFEGHTNHGNIEKKDRQKFGLLPVRFATWHDWIFVNLDGKALDFDAFIEPIRSRYSGYPLENCHRGNVAYFEFQSNFKLALDNWADNYHLFAVHPALDQTMANEDRKSLENVGPHAFCRYGFIGDSDTGIEPTSGGVALPRAEGMSEAYQRSGGLGTIFPNIGLFASPTCFLFINIRPLAVDKCQMEVHFYYGSKEAAVGDQYTEARQALEAQWANLNEEDMTICHRSQVGRSCDDFDGGQLAPFWDLAQINLHRQWADAMVGEGLFAAVDQQVGA